MRVRARVGSLVAAFAALCVLAPAAYGAVVEIDSTPGAIFDVDATRILFKKSNDELGVKDRATQQVTTIAAPSPRHVSGGSLTPHGVLFGSHYANTPSQLHEVYDGTLTTLYSGATSSEVDGNFAIWTGPDLGFAEANLYMRDLTTPPVVGGLPIASNALISDNDVAPNGDVVYATPDFEVKRYRSGTTETLGAGDEEREREWAAVTDGVNALWRETGGAVDALRGDGPGGAFTLADTDRNYFPSPGDDYRVAGGWIAFTRGNADSHIEVWLRDPGGDETKVADAGANSILGLADDGDLVYRDAPFPENHVYLYQPGGGAQSEEITGDVSSLIGEPMFKSGGRWYAISGQSLKRFGTDDLQQGAKTSIDSAPSGGDNPTHATFAFSSVPADESARFQCSLDGGDYESCTSTAEYTGLQHGVHTFAVRSVDVDDHVDIDPATAQWGVDPTPPDVTIDPPPARTSDDSPTISGGAGSADEDDAKVTIQVHSGDSIFGTLVRTIETTRTGGTWTADVTPELPDGLYTLVAKQSDDAGNVGTSATRSFFVDTSPPSPGFSTPSFAVAGTPVTLDSSNSSDDAGGTVVHWEWDVDGDGDFERDTGATSHTTVTYSAVGHVHPGVRVTDSVGNQASVHVDLPVVPKPPPGLVGVTINDGDRFTNTPEVFVQPVWPVGDTDLILSNDGGFRDAVTRPLRDNVPWRLDSSGPERLPKTIYARFDPNGTTYQDDIILDETAPTVMEAEITGVGSGVAAAAATATRKRTYHLHVKARDRTAGVSRMQITTNRSHPGRKRRFRKRVDFRATTSKIFVRVRDRARNWSRWKRCEK